MKEPGIAKTYLLGSFIPVLHVLPESLAEPQVDLDHIAHRQRFDRIDFRVR
jgi:hypothetical protein